MPCCCLHEHQSAEVVRLASWRLLRWKPPRCGARPQDTPGALGFLASAVGLWRYVPWVLGWTGAKQLQTTRFLAQHRTGAGARTVRYRWKKSPHWSVINLHSKLKTKICCYFVCISLWPRENVGEASLPAHAVSNPETHTHQDGNSGSLLAKCVGCCCSRVPKDARSGFGFSRTTLIEQVLVFSIFKCIDQTRSWLFCLWLMDTSAPENWPASQNPIPKSG